MSTQDAADRVDATGNAELDVEALGTEAGLSAQAHDQSFDAGWGLMWAVVWASGTGQQGAGRAGSIAAQPFAHRMA